LIDPAGQADAGAFLVRLLRLDRGAVVRLRPATATRAAAAGTAAATEAEVTGTAGATAGSDPATELWAMLPFDVLATRRVRSAAAADVTVSAADLLASLEGGGPPRPRDTDWRWALPPGRGTAVERIPAAELVRVAAAASRTLRQAVAEGVGGRAVGERVVRDALLDHVAIAITGADGERIDIPVRVVQGVVRMGFLLANRPVVASGSKVTTSEDFVTVRSVMGWTGIDASYGSVWYRPSYPLRFR
jgi:hypothetical protein